MCLQFNGLRFSTSTPTTQCIQLFDSKFPAVFHCQKVTDHFPCLPHFLLLNAESKGSSRTDEIRHYDCHVKFENNTSGRARLWDTALKFLCPGLSITSPDHLNKTVVEYDEAHVGIDKSYCYLITRPHPESILRVRLSAR